MLNIRWMKPRHTGTVARISRDLSEAEITAHLRDSNTISMILCDETETEIGAFVVYKFAHKSYELIHIETTPGQERKGNARQLIQRVQEKARDAGGRRDLIFASVPEDRLPAQLFLRELGFLAVAVEGDSYRFRWTAADGEQHMQGSSNERVFRSGS